MIYSDKTGKFPYSSNRGNQHIMVLYDWNSNAILVEQTKNRSKEEIAQAIKKLFKYLKSRGIQPRLHTMENEASIFEGIYD